MKNEGDGEDQDRDLPDNNLTGKRQKSHSLVPGNTLPEDQRENSFIARSRSGSQPGVASSASPSTTRHSEASAQSSSSSSTAGLSERTATCLSRLSASTLSLSTSGITTSSIPGSSNRNSSLSNDIEEEIYPKPTASELRVAQYEKPLTKGHCPKRKNKSVAAEGNEGNTDGRKDPEKLAKRRSEKRERYYHSLQRLYIPKLNFLCHYYC